MPQRGLEKGSRKRIPTGSSQTFFISTRNVIGFRGFFFRITAFFWEIDCRPTRAQCSEIKFGKCRVGLPFFSTIFFIVLHHDMPLFAVVVVVHIFFSFILLHSGFARSYLQPSWLYAKTKKKELPCVVLLLVVVYRIRRPCVRKTLMQ